MYKLFKFQIWNDSGHFWWHTTYLKLTSHIKIIDRQGTCGSQDILWREKWLSLYFIILDTGFSLHIYSSGDAGMYPLNYIYRFSPTIL
jgi:hypothetical protein